MKFNRSCRNLAVVAALITPCAAHAAAGPPAQERGAPPSIEQFVVPPTLHRLQATVHHTQSNMDVLRKIGGDYASANAINDVTYVYTAPDTVEARGRYGILSGSVTTTDTVEHISVGIFHQTKDISRDITRRQTIAGLGLLPENYLDIMRSQYIGADTVNGVKCDIFMLRYITDEPNDNRRFETWVSVDKHYIVKETKWDGGNHQHETIVYSDPVVILPGIWMPTQVAVYDAQGQLGGMAVQQGISAS